MKDPREILQKIDFDKPLTKDVRKLLAQFLIGISQTIGFKISSRGWAYQLETERIINKDQFDKVQKAVNKCRSEGLLPIDFVAENKERMFQGIETPEDRTPEEMSAEWLQQVLDIGEYYTPDWWKGESHYIQMVVEKVDLITLFSPVCRTFKIPIASSKGWASMSQRADYARRFKEAEMNGLKPVLLYCGDHDPDGILIADTLRKNIDDMKNVVWQDGSSGYDPENLIIDRFGLTKEFIDENGLTWIDNLITGGTAKKSLADPSHRNHSFPYVQEYLSTIGERKCEANALIPYPRAARQMCRSAIEKYLGLDSEDRFRAKREEIKNQVREFHFRTGLDESIREAMRIIRDDEK